jgi:REP element-mobilizing transposase RayT
MPRRLRLHVPGGFYHVTLRGNHQQEIFFIDGDRRLLNTIVARAMQKFGARIHAYCWMTNHLHLLTKVGDEPLAAPMRQIASEYARAVQLRLETTGHFFERRYHATLVDADSYLLQLLRYIHMNPVQAGIVSDPSCYPWSSHHNYVNARSEPWVVTDFALAMFARQRVRAIARYREFLQEEGGSSWSPEVTDRDGVAVLGSDEFIASLDSSVPARRSRQTLADLILEACRRFDVDPARLESPVYDAYLVKVRAWIAHQARLRGIASLSAVARALGRHEATLRYALRTYPEEIE